MLVDNQPTKAEVLARRRNYDFYVRIVDPGRHVFKTRLSFERCFYSLFGLAGSAFLLWMGFFCRRPVGHFGRIPLATPLAVLTWSGALILLVGSAWYVLRGVVLEITPRQISVRHRAFFLWTKKKWDLSSFVTAAVEPSFVFSRGGSATTSVPLLTFTPWDTIAMGFGLDSRELAEEFVRDINASVKRAREAPRTF